MRAGSQGRAGGLLQRDPGFTRDLYESLPTGTVRVYVCEVDGEFVGGKITLEVEDTCYSWQTVAGLDSDLAATDLIDWTVMQEPGAWAHADRPDRCEEQRRCGYKAEFNPVVETHYCLESSSASTGAIKAVHKRVR